MKYLKIKFKRLKGPMLSAVALFTMFLISATMISIPTTNAQIAVPERKTAGYISVNPHTIGLNQELTVNLWIYPAPAGPHFEAGYTNPTYFHNITVTFARPDGTKDTFMPLDGSSTENSSLGIEEVGTMWFLYKPNQVGTWTAEFSFPGETYAALGYSVYYTPVTSQSVTFTVQKDAVQVGLQPVSLPTGYWTRPINAENREWSQISGASGLINSISFTYGFFKYSPYTTAPNSPHIIWTNEASIGGLVGGEYGALSYGAGGGSPAVIMDGKVYYNMPGNVFRCVDLRTGELLWTMPGAISSGYIGIVPETALTGMSAPGTASAYLWEFGTTAWKEYEALTGTMTMNLPITLSNIGTPVWADNYVCYIIRQGTWDPVTERRPFNELIKWDMNKMTGNNWTTGIIWTVNLKQADGTGPGEGGRGSSFSIFGDLGLVYTFGEDMYHAFDLKTGALLWVNRLPYPVVFNLAMPNGNLATWNCVEMKFHCYKISSTEMTELWTSEVGDVPWGSNTECIGFAYNNIYCRSYDGHIYALDANTGKINWNFYFGSTTETPYGTWPSWTNMDAAEGKLYVGASEHSPTQPRPRGDRLYCLDAYTGTEIWNISGAIGASAIAEGYLLGANEYDGLLYCFGKGQTATMVSAPQTAITKGTSILISGTVMDQSPAQPGTPAVSDSSMTSWMEYLHMQKAQPANVQGVPVLLTATAPDGSTINIGETTSDGYASFAYLWTPPGTGIYKVQATFAGSESYWSSTAETNVGVVASTTSPSASELPGQTTPSQTTSPGTTSTTSLPSSSSSASSSVTVAPQPSSEAASSMTLYIAIAAAAVIIVIVATAIVLKRRK
jgi:outer membrane protein assembly factor BamB